jgi:hypothetical protein
MRDFYQDIIDIIGSGGEACCVIPIGDSKHENAAHTTVTSKGQGALGGLVFTYSKARNTWDAPTIYYRNRFQASIQEFDGADEEADSPDAAAWSRDDGSSEGMTMGALVNTNTTAAQDIIARREGSTLREWQFYLNGSIKPGLSLIDESANVGADSIGGPAIPLNTRTVVSYTYDGTGGTTAANGMTCYVNGIAVASTAYNNGSYVAMENLATTTTLGMRNGPAGLFSGGLGVVYFSHRTCTAADMQNVNDIIVAMQRATRSRLLAGVA